jgi:hypothetical protein
LRRKVVRTTKRGKLQNMENQSHGIWRKRDLEVTNRTCDNSWKDWNISNPHVSRTFQEQCKGEINYHLSRL